MLETTLTQLERLLDDLLQQNSAQPETIARLERELLQLREENDNLQLSNLEQDEQLTTTLDQLKGMLARSGGGFLGARGRSGLFGSALTTSLLRLCGTN